MAKIKVLCAPNAPNDFVICQLLAQKVELFFLDGTQNFDALTKATNFAGVRNLVQGDKTKLFLQAIAETEPDVLYLEYCSGGGKALSDILAAIKNQYPLVKIVTWHGDASCIGFDDISAGIRQIHQYIDIGFFVDEKIVNSLNADGSNRARFILQCGVSECFHPLGLDKEYDLCFVGGSYGGFDKEQSPTNIRTRALSYIYENFHKSPMAYIGDRRYKAVFPSFYKADSTMGSAPNDWHITCNDWYNRSRIVLCVDVSDADKFMSVRSANALLSGSMVLAHYNKGYEDIFSNHKNLVWYNDLSELKDLIQHYLHDSTNREAIAKEGREHALKIGLTREGHVVRLLESFKELMG